MRPLRVVLTAIAAGALTVIVLLLLEVQTEFLWGWALLVAGLTLLVSVGLPDDPRTDGPRTPAPPEYVGSDVSRLAWAINTHSDTVNEGVTRRVRATLRRRLLQHGVDIDDDAQRAAADRLLGPGLWQRLNGRRTRIADLRDALAAVERLPYPHDAMQHPEPRPQRESTT
ncbi:hypothetical protein Q9R19_07640 [Microbacterium sp. ARD32]|uniref:hypothetical protein n=1 Tax=Microbacterium sp. ARD32 TaxID=2962577 RepID=UPI00288212D8|nr:hypothetical protein [Microbacterium sp. ARD32]MDT0157490.1 hypothetical protein [Microbacterium sp. ARD32]